MTAAQPDYALIDRVGLGWQIFYPRVDTAPAPRGAIDDALRVEPGVVLSSRFYPADPAWPTILLFHGNGEVARDYDGIAPLYHAAHINLWVADYRGYGASSGRPTFAALVGDAHPVLARFHALLDEHGFSPERFIMGRSLGAHPALEIAARGAARLRGLVIESGAGNLRRLVQRVSPEVPVAEAETLLERHRAKLAAITLPALVIHGEEDDLIPLESAVEFYDTLTMSRKEIVIIPGAGHNDLLWVGAQAYFDALARFVGQA